MMSATLEMIVALVLTTAGPWHLDTDVGEMFRTMPAEQCEKIHAILVNRGICEPDERWASGFFHGFMGVMRARATGQSHPQLDPNYYSDFQRKRRGE